MKAPKPLLIFPNPPCASTTFTIPPGGPAVSGYVRKDIWLCPCGHAFTTNQLLHYHVISGECTMLRWRSWG